MHAGSILTRGKPHHPKVSRLHCGGDVVTADFLPSHQVLRWDQDAAVGSCSAAGAAGQAIEVLGHRAKSMARGCWAHAVDFAPQA
jgi:hypothetical protein